MPNSGTGGQNNRPYIDYSGYRIYVGDGTKITNITYYVFDTNDATNNEQFQNLTNIDPQNLTQLHASASGYDINFDQTQQLQGTVYYWLVA